MRLIQLDGGRWGLQENVFSSALVAAGRQIPGMSWSPGERCWAGSRDAVDLCAALLCANGIAVDDGAPQPPHSTHSRESADTAMGALLVADAGLRDYQKAAVRFLLEKRAALLADTMGLGKTASALTAARALDRRTLIVAPNMMGALPAHWQAEIAKWWPAVGPLVFRATGAKPANIPYNARLIIIHYEILPGWSDALADWAPEVGILDEVHALMNESSARSKAARQVLSTAKYRWGLSGTPLTNRPRDLWNVVDTLSPGRFGNFFSYGIRYCAGHKENVTPTKAVWNFSGKSNLEELRHRLSYFMLRRLTSDVALELPAKTRQVVWVDLPAAKRRMPTDASPREMRAALDKSADAKLDAAQALIQDHVEQGHKVIAFTYRRSVAEWLVTAARGASQDAELVHGGAPPLRRGTALERAKGASGGHLLAATIDSSSTGIDLSYADVCVFVELTWEPHELLQAEARLHRYGQKNPVLIQYVIARGTGDELIANVVVGKLDTFERAVGVTGEGLSEAFAESEDAIMAQLYQALSSPEFDVVAAPRAKAKKKRSA